MGLLRTKELYLEACHKSKDLHVLSRDELQQLQAHLRKMYLDVEKICAKHGLRMMVGFGSVLGAVRHNGFIPWDDDMDLLMPREDYDKLIHEYAKELPSNYKLFAPNSKNGAKTRFCKIIDMNTKFITPFDDVNDMNNGIFLDIFPLENTPTNKCHITIRKYCSFFLMYVADSVAHYNVRTEAIRKLMSYSCLTRCNYLFRQAIGCVFSFYNYKKWYNIIDKYQNYRKDTGFLCWPAGPANGNSFQPREKSMFLPISRGKFDDIEVNLPAQPIKFCELQYGNWKKLPTSEERWQHFLVEIKFSKEDNATTLKQS